METFKVGDVVQFKSGGLKMTVKEIINDYAHVYYIDITLKICLCNNIPIECLEKVRETDKAFS